MKNIIKKIIKRIFDIGFSGYAEKLFDINGRLSSINSALSQVEQKRLFLYYQQLLHEKKPLPSIKDVGFRVFSQNDEDGILLYIFSLIGTTNKLCFDLAHESPLGANTTNLLCNFGWSGLLVCANVEEEARTKKFFYSHPDTVVSPPRILNQWVTVENVNAILCEHGLQGQIDLFSLDIDGVDYWIWKNLEAIDPRVVVVEFHSMWGAQRAVTVPYHAAFDRFKEKSDFFGASLAAFVKLADEKGYRLVGGNKYCFNAFFIKKGIGEDLIPTLSTQEFFSLYSQPAWSIEHNAQRLSRVKDCGWIDL
jgi:hypothetical protein